VDSNGGRNSTEVHGKGDQSRSGHGNKTESGMIAGWSSDNVEVNEQLDDKSGIRDAPPAPETNLSHFLRSQGRSRFVDIRSMILSKEIDSNAFEVTYFLRRSLCNKIVVLGRRLKREAAKTDRVRKASFIRYEAFQSREMLCLDERPQTRSPMY